MQRQSRRETGGGGGGGGSAPSGGGGGGGGGGGEEGASGSSDAARAATFTQGAGDVLIGVVTARVTGAVEIEDVDVERWLPGGGDNGALARIFGGGGMDNGDNASTSYEGDVSTAPFLPPSTPYAYILTLGTLASHRRLGIASKLLERVVTRARHEHGCKVVYLHVITHNEGAIRFYRGHRFAQVRRLANFYTIPDAAAKGGGEDGVVQLVRQTTHAGAVSRIPPV
jgi:GNAT superfamily N-acetyltransferase